MIAWRMVRTSPLRLRVRRSRHKAGWRAFLRSAPGSRRSSLERVPPRARRTDRIARRLRTSASRSCRKALSLSWRRRAFALQRASPPGRVRRRRRPRRARVRSAGTSRPPPARACASSPSRAPCGGGSRGRVRHMGLPPLGLRRIGRVGSPGPSRGRARTDCDREREESFRTGGTCRARGGRRCAACGVRDRTCASSPGPCGAWFSPYAGEVVRPARRLAGGSPPGGTPSPAQHPGPHEVLAP